MKILDIRNKLRQLITIEQRKIADRLASGSAADFADYKRSTGRIAGLQDGLNIVEEVFMKLTDEGETD